MRKRLIILAFLALAVGWLFSTITLISPNGGETWTPGYQYNITWSWTTNETGNMKIELYRYTTLAATISSSTAINEGHLYWYLPITLTPATNYNIKITSLSNTSVYDWCDAFLTITTAPTVTVTSPNGGENWNKGGIYPITWSSTNLTGSVYIMLLINTSGNSMTITAGAQVNSGSYSWTIPNSIVENGSVFKIKIASNTVPAVRDTSNNFFSINPPITITTPSGGELWYTGSTYVITWTSNNVAGSALIELYQGTNTTPTSTIVSSTVMSYGNRVWTIPTTISPGNNYKIKVSSLTTPTMYDYSASFNISDPIGNNDPNVTPLLTALQGNFPNPFSHETEIRYSIKSAGYVSLGIYDVKGRLVKQLLNTKSAVGSFSTMWDGTDDSGQPVAKGIYYVKMTTDAYRTSKKIVFMK